MQDFWSGVDKWGWEEKLWSDYDRKSELYVVEIKLALYKINCKWTSSAVMRLQIKLDTTLSKGLRFGSKTRKYMILLCSEVSNWLGSLLYVC